jgi:DNA end-binding protein Ku
MAAKRPPHDPRRGRGDARARRAHAFSGQGAAEKDPTSGGRALWTGAISFGLVTIPVRVHSAVESREELSFHLLHKKDESRIEYRRFCAAEDVEVPWSEIAKGNEYRRNTFVILTEEDFARARVEATQTFAIQAFVPARDIDYLYFDHPYYLMPAGKAGARAYLLLRDALQKAERVGIGTIVLRQREHLAALEPAGPALTLTTMRFAREIRPPGSLGLPREASYAKKELALADQLIESLSAPWNPADYRDTYAEVLKGIIKRKAAGTPIEAPAPARRPAKVVDLVKALEESLRHRGRARGAGKEKPPRGRAA